MVTTRLDARKKYNARTGQSVAQDSSEQLKQDVLKLLDTPAGQLADDPSQVEVATYRIEGVRNIPTDYTATAKGAILRLNKSTTPNGSFKVSGNFQTSEDAPMQRIGPRDAKRLLAILERAIKRMERTESND